MLTAEQRKISYRICGPRPEAMRLAGYFLAFRRKHIYATLPEAIFYDYCTREQLIFLYQADLYGGRQVRGGFVPDFLIDSGGIWTVVLVQGDYWHSTPEARVVDARYREVLFGKKFNGIRVGTIVELWESRIMDCQRDIAMRLATEGVELGRLG